MPLEISCCAAQVGSPTKAPRRISNRPQYQPKAVVGSYPNRGHARSAHIGKLGQPRLRYLPRRDTPESLGGIGEVGSTLAPTSTPCWWKFVMYMWC
ncbi:hypothetical protein PGTUg99_015097 [Puccinia graminis f. sp. tritici]|uniref:Uncharacterized protein n=1 Tax=Puccinia graminis f. sp. tritici TaxID=56615 RepID=A0A5B0QL81_PUCGR|nr:hypothetical protein PGTUg99_015097 [Puccinia graminis f. sp. tritici]